MNVSAYWNVIKQMGVCKNVLNAKRFITKAAQSQSLDAFRKDTFVYGKRKMQY